MTTKSPFCCNHCFFGEPFNNTISWAMPSLAFLTDGHGLDRIGWEKSLDSHNFNYQEDVVKACQEKEQTRCVNNRRELLVWEGEP